jgi:hypothetical protein
LKEEEEEEEEEEFPLFTTVPVMAFNFILSDETETEPVAFLPLKLELAHNQT